MCSRITELAKLFCAIIEKSRIFVGGLVCVARFVLGILNFIIAASNKAFVFTCPMVFLFGFAFMFMCYCGLFFRQGCGTVRRSNGTRRGALVQNFESQQK